MIVTDMVPGGVGGLLPINRHRVILVPSDLKPEYEATPLPKPLDEWEVIDVNREGRIPGCGFAFAAALQPGMLLDLYFHAQL